MKEKIGFLVVDVVFVAVGLLAAASGRLPNIPEWLFFVCLGFAAFRAGRAVSFNLIFKWLRDAVDVVEVADSSGAGNSNEATGEGFRRVLGELVSCPICSGTWASMVLLALVALVPDIGRVFVLSLGAAGMAEVLNWVSEFYSWNGRAAREDAGSQWLVKNATPDRPFVFLGRGNGKKERIH